jgi:hypothetical protein
MFAVKAETKTVIVVSIKSIDFERNEEHMIDLMHTQWQCERVNFEPISLEESL